MVSIGFTSMLQTQKESKTNNHYNVVLQIFTQTFSFVKRIETTFSCNPMIDVLNLHPNSTYIIMKTTNYSKPIMLMLTTNFSPTTQHVVFSVI